MGFMDKVKETAAKAGEAAKDAGKAAQDKIEEQKVKKKISDLKEELGGVVFAQRTGAANPAGDASFDATVDRLVAEITEQEAALAAIGETPAD
jgi:hypothetical protein